MKGPGLRISLALARWWKCPACGRKKKTSGDTVSQRCSCTEAGVWMQFNEDAFPPSVLENRPPVVSDTAPVNMEVAEPVAEILPAPEIEFVPEPPLPEAPPTDDAEFGSGL